MRHNIKLSMLATVLPTIAARQSNLVQLTKKSVLLLLMLATGLVAHATIQSNIKMLGFTQTISGQTHYAFAIESIWGENRPTGEGSSYTFSNTTIAEITLNGTLNFQEGTALADVVTGSEFTVTITKNNQWFYGATVQTQSGTEVTDCTVTTSNNPNKLTVTIPQGKTFGTILVDYVVKEPFNGSNTVISGIASDYVYTGSPIVPVPTVTYNGTLLTEGTDYTVSYSNNTLDPLHYTITGHVTVMGMGDYAGSVEQSFTYHNVNLSDFTQLSDGSYQIATQQDLDHLALLVNVAGNNCHGLTFKQASDIAYTYTTSWDSSDSENNFTAIGGNDKPFKGTFDGQNHSISGIRITKTGRTDSDQCQGLFGYVGTGGTVRNVVLADTRIKGFTGTGGIVGVNEGTIEDCRVQSNVLVMSSGDGSDPDDDNGSDFGGIAGSNNNGGTVTHCTSSVTIDGKIGSYLSSHGIIQTYSDNLGGIVGNNSGTVSNCLALNAVVTGKNYAAAIVGNNNIGNNAGSLTANYYRSCIVTNGDYSDGSYINVGIGFQKYSYDPDGARSVHALTLGTGITATGESVVIDGTTYYASSTTVTLGHSGTVPAGQMLVYLVNGTAIGGNTFTMRANDNTTVSMAISLADNSDNNSVISNNTGSGKNVILTGRTLYKDGSWNTLCLPFEVSTESGPLAGATAMTLKTSTSGFNNGTLTLDFTSATSIPAGTPFIIKWNEGTPLTNPVFTGVTISTATNNATVPDVFTFIGTYSPVSISSAGDNTILYLGAENTLYWPNGTMTIGSQRAYFQLLGDLTAGDPTSTIKSFVLNFDEETRIRTTNLTNLTNGADAWYDLSGRKLEGKPTQKGIYIHGNKKVIIK